MNKILGFIGGISLSLYACSTANYTERTELHPSIKSIPANTSVTMFKFKIKAYELIEPTNMKDKFSFTIKLADSPLKFRSFLSFQELELSLKSSNLQYKEIYETSLSEFQDSTVEYSNLNSINYNHSCNIIDNIPICEPAKLEIGNKFELTPVAYSDNKLEIVLNYSKISLLQMNHYQGVDLPDLSNSTSLQSLRLSESNVYFTFVSNQPTNVIFAISYEPVQIKACAESRDIIY